MYERGSKKRDPEKLKAIFSSNLEQSIMPADISKNIVIIKLNNKFRAKPRATRRRI